MHCCETGQAEVTVALSKCQNEPHLLEVELGQQVQVMEARRQLKNVGVQPAHTV